MAIVKPTPAGTPPGHIQPLVKQAQVIFYVGICCYVRGRFRCQRLWHHRRIRRWCFYAADSHLNIPHPDSDSDRLCDPCSFSSRHNFDSAYNVRRGLVDFLVGILLEVPTVLATVLGAWLTDYLPTWQLEILFSLMVITAGLVMFRNNTGASVSRFSVFKKLNRLPPRLVRETANGSYELSGITVTIFGLASGLIAGLFGIGGGFIKGPLMVLGFGMPARVAAPTALFMIVITSAVGSISHYLLGHIQWKIGLFLVVAFTLGAVFGNRQAGKLAEKSLVQFIAGGLIAAGLAMTVFTFLTYFTH